jgi:hypothetical protein
MDSISRSAFLSLDHVAQMSQIRSGIKIIDDPPVRGELDDMPYISDGAERLRWIQSKRSWDAETARLKAVEAAAEHAEFLNWKTSR